MVVKNKLFIIALSLVLICKPILAAEECFEGTSRAIFKFNMAFDNAIVEPLAKGYNKLPEPIKNGTSNFTSNIANSIYNTLKTPYSFKPYPTILKMRLNQH